MKTLITKIKKAYKHWQAERRRQAFLAVQLDKLTDPTFLDRVASEDK